MTEKINCPFCGNLIDVDVIKCDHCGSLFQDPDLPGIKFKELGPFLAIDLLTFGFFSTIWFFINGKAINKFVGGKSDGLKLNWLFLLLAVNGGFYLLFFYKQPALLIFFSVLQCLIYIALSYRVLRIIQKYTKRMYNSEIIFNPYYMVIFNVFYLIHYIETYRNRVYHTHEYFDWKSPQAIFLIILLIIILCIFRFYNDVFWLFH